MLKFCAFLQQGLPQIWHALIRAGMPHTWDSQSRACRPSAGHAWEGDSWLLGPIIQQAKQPLLSGSDSLQSSQTSCNAVPVPVWICTPISATCLRDFMNQADVLGLPNWTGVVASTTLLQLSCRQVQLYKPSLPLCNAGIKFMMQPQLRHGRRSAS
eukprot:1159123-Pelagomonas_calceolata.AAC.11